MNSTETLGEIIKQELHPEEKEELQNWQAIVPEWWRAENLGTQSQRQVVL